MTTVPLGFTAEAIVDGNGNATARCGPNGPGEVWLPTQVSVRVANNQNESQCTVYVGNRADASTYVDFTATGSTGDISSRINGVEVRSGSQVWAVWTGADIGSLARLIVTGTKEIQ